MFDFSFFKVVIKPGENSAADAGVDEAIQCSDDDAVGSCKGLVAGVDGSHDFEEFYCVIGVHYVGNAGEEHAGAPEDASGQSQCFNVEFHIVPSIFRVFIKDFFNIDPHPEIANLLVFSKNKMG